MAARYPSAPPPTPVRVRQAVDAIEARRRTIDDDDLHHWSDTPADALDYALRYRSVPEHVQVADARDALLLIRAQRAQLDVLELQALDTCRRPGKHRVPWSALAEDLGLSSPQAVDQRRDRLRASIAEQARGADNAASPEEREQAWTLAHGARIRTTAAALIRAIPDITATGNTEAVDVMEDIELMLDGYRASHTQHAALLTQFRFLGEALGAQASLIPAVRTATALADEYRAATI